MAITIDYIRRDSISVINFPQNCSIYLSSLFANLLPLVNILFLLHFNIIYYVYAIQNITEDTKRGEKL